jgi:hypothetical protein
VKIIHEDKRTDALAQSAHCHFRAHIKALLLQPLLLLYTQCLSSTATKSLSNLNLPCLCLLRTKYKLSSLVTIATLDSRGLVSTTTVLASRLALGLSCTRLTITLVNLYILDNDVTLDTCRVLAYAALHVDPTEPFPYPVLSDFIENYQRNHNIRKFRNEEACFDLAMLRRSLKQSRNSRVTFRTLLSIDFPCRFSLNPEIAPKLAGLLAHVLEGATESAASCNRCTTRQGRLANECRAMKKNLLGNRVDMNHRCTSCIVLGRFCS